MHVGRDQPRYNDPTGEIILLILGILFFQETTFTNIGNNVPSDTNGAIVNDATRGVNSDYCGVGIQHGEAELDFLL